MRSGINFYESPYPGSPLETLNNLRGDWVRVLDRLRLRRDRSHGRRALPARDRSRENPYLVLKQGQWNGSQVVSSDWLERSTAPVTAAASRFGGVSVDYGLLWWMAV
jgi:hypothetical protein